MPRLTVPLAACLRQPARGRSFIPAYRHFASTQTKDSGAQNSRPGWSGRKGDDHVLNRQEHDQAAKSSGQARRDHEEMKEGSGAISRKDEGNNNERAKKDHPEAPDVVIGMNDERGGVRLRLTCCCLKTNGDLERALIQICNVNRVPPHRNGAGHRKIGQAEIVTFQHERQECHSYQQRLAVLRQLFFLHPLL